MKTVNNAILGLVLAFAAIQAAHADFSYTTTRKQASGAPSADSGAVTKQSFKGQKMMTESANTATVFDFDAQTLTSINKTAKTYSVRPFSELEQTMASNTMDAKIDVKETGQHKTINGYNASEVLITMTADAGQAGRGMQMQVEIDSWVSSDIPGSGEIRAFWQRNAERFPFVAMAGGGNSAMAKSMAEAQRRLAKIGGVPVLQVIRIKSAGGTEQAEKAQQGMAKAQSQLEEMVKQGGPGAAAAKQALARMGAMGTAGGGMETTVESGNFSTGSIPESAFAVPAGFQKSAVK